LPASYHHNIKLLKCKPLQAVEMQEEQRNRQGKDDIKGQEVENVEAKFGIGLPEANRFPATTAVHMRMNE